MTVDRKKLRDLAETATPGPWCADHDRVCDGHCGDPVRYHDGSCCDHQSPVGCHVERHRDCNTVVREIENEHDAAFIAAANPQTILEMLDEITAKQCGYDDLHHMVPGKKDIWSKVDALLKQLAAMTAARDEACDIADTAITLQSDFLGRHDKMGSVRAAELRKVGA